MQHRTNHLVVGIAVGILSLGCLVQAFSSSASVRSIRPHAVVVPWQRQPPRVDNVARFAQDDDTGIGATDGSIQEGDDKDDNKDSLNHSSRKTTYSRAGGRASSPNKRKPATERRSVETPKNKDWGIGKLTIIPLLALWIALQALFGGGSSSPPSYIFYQSSVSESRTYGADGRLQSTTRKESVKSNLPSSSLLEKDQRKLLDIDRELDREIDLEIQQSMRRLQQISMFDDFF
jgi:hypothetical protein